MDTVDHHNIKNNACIACSLKRDRIWTTVNYKSEAAGYVDKSYRSIHSSNKTPKEIPNEKDYLRMCLAFLGSDLGAIICAPLCHLVDCHAYACM